MIIHKLLTRLFFFVKTRTYKGRLKYIYENHGSKKLVVSFTAFSDKPCFNYYRTLKSVTTADKLFLQDNFGYTGSYLLYENGIELPKQLTLGLLNMILAKKKYEEIVTIGTSKGGTDAIIFGLEIGASNIYSGASQYYLGKYLNAEGRKKIFYAMMGENSSDPEQAVLDSIMPDVIKKHKDSKSIIHILYSKREHTYDEHIKFMIEDLKQTNIQFTEIVEDFEEHNDVGRNFSPYILSQLRNKIHE